MSTRCTGGNLLAECVRPHDLPDLLRRRFAQAVERHPHHGLYSAALWGFKQ